MRLSVTLPKILHITPRAVLSAVCDPRQEALDQIRQTFPISHLSMCPPCKQLWLMSTDPVSVLSSNDIDAVVIATATGTHVDLTLGAIKAGKASYPTPSVIYADFDPCFLPARSSGETHFYRFGELSTSHRC